MKRMLLPLLLLAALLVPATAQEAEPRPEFDNAPVTDVLMWAQKSVGCGFIYEAEVLRDGEGQLRKVTARHAQPKSTAEKTVLLFELLRRCGLVAFEVGGLPGPTYQLYHADGAMRAAPLVDHPDKIKGLFGAISIRLFRASALEVAERIRPTLTKGIGSVQVFSDTHAVIITDWRDRLVVAHEIALAADKPAERADDLLVRDYSLRVVPSEKALAALERLREPGESWKAAAHETANVLLFSGKRAELDRVHERARMLDRHEERPEFAEVTRTIKLIHLTPAQGAGLMREMFAPGISAGSVQIGAFDRDRKLVFRGSEFDYRRAVDTLKVMDQPAEEKKK
ncbi:MAG: hypothetical protein KF696_03055 [Planctomycetes bacterium]|nr:hypothetical protein [Planctomycetota bacterium]MCW8134984.1 hypothetical protein [Planctomycetota bacterium]